MATILVVEDNDYNVRPIEMTLKYNYNIAIEIAKDGQSAIDMFRDNFSKTCCDTKYKMILMDLHMQKMDGF